MADSQTTRATQKPQGDAPVGPESRKFGCNGSLNAAGYSALPIVVSLFSFKYLDI